MTASPTRPARVAGPHGDNSGAPVAGHGFGTGRCVSSAKCADRTFAANGLAFDVNPSKLSVSEIVIKQPYAKVIILPDATVNLANAFGRCAYLTDSSSVYM